MQLYKGKDTILCLKLTRRKEIYKQKTSFPPEHQLFWQTESHRTTFVFVKMFFRGIPNAVYFKKNLYQFSYDWDATKTRDDCEAHRSPNSSLSP